MSQYTLTETERAILQYVARHALENTDNRDSWCRWVDGPPHPWGFRDYKPLVQRGLLERRETWADILLRLTDEGWAVLNA